MKNLLDISRYKLCIIGLYIIIFPMFFIFTPNALQYSFSTIYLGQITLTIFVTFVSFYLLNSLFKFRKIEWQGLRFSRIVLVIMYALLFAIPEEIIFRGIIQNFLQDSIESMTIVITTSSLIFGLAHLPNGGKGLHPRYWNWRFTLVAFLAGLPLSLIFAITNSLLIPTILHAFFLIFFKLLSKETAN